MIFDLANAHLGDFLLALPAMHPEDEIILKAEHRVPRLPLRWLDVGAGIRPDGKPGLHVTDAWLEATGRPAMRWQLLPHQHKSLTVIAPCVASRSRQWHAWEWLRKCLPGATWVDDKLPRKEWMALLNQAKTVICPDTGTAHMADALGCPKVVGLYAKHFATHAPYWNRNYCISKRSMDEITVDDVMERVNG